MLLMATITMVAIPAFNGAIVRTLPNGEKITVWLHGDEYYSYYTDSIGNRVRFDEQGWCVPDTCSAITVAARRQERVAAMQTQNTPKRTEWKGNAKGLVILVAFKDVPFSIENPQEAFRSMLNDKGYSENSGTGSARDYFEASSMGQLIPDFDVYGPYTLSNTRAYYGSGTNGYDARPGVMIKEACQLAYADGVKLAPYDNDGDGYIDNVFVYYAGVNEAEGGPSECIWPHRSVVYGSGTYFAGKQIYDYACTSELRGNSGVNMAGIGTFCHEFSHVLGLKDHYNTSDKNAYTTGDWDIMAQGSYNNDGRTPPNYTAFERFIIGWLTPTQISAEGTYTLNPIETHNEAYLIASSKHNLSSQSPSPSEYFLLENRQYIGWDTLNIDDDHSAQPGHGLLISHITFNSQNYAANRFNNSLPLGYDIVEAGNPEPKKSTGFDTYPGAAGVTSFTPTLNNGEALSTLAIHSITEWEDDHTIQFRIGSQDTTQAHLQISPTDIPLIETDVEKGKIVRYHPVPVRITGNHIKSDSVYISSSLINMYLSSDTTKWEKSALSVPVNTNGTIDQTVWLRFRSTRASCMDYTGSLKAYTKGHTCYDTKSIVARSPQTTYVTTPTSVIGIAQSSSSIYLTWDAVPGAEVYQVQIYTTRPDGTPVYIYPFGTLPTTTETNFTISGLQTNRTYYAQVQAGANNTCDFGYTDGSAPIVINLDNNNTNQKANQMAVHTNYDGHRLVVMTPASAEDGTLYIFDVYGHLHATIDVPANSPYTVLDAYLELGKTIFLCKYSNNGKIRHKNPWAKISL